MKKFIQKNWFKLLIILLLIFSFYWYEWRPYIARKECIKKIAEKAEGKGNKSLDYWKDFYEVLYQSCMNKHGLLR